MTRQGAAVATQMVFIPATLESLPGLLAGGDAVDGWAATPAVRQADGVDDPEEADYRAQCRAGLAGLEAAGGPRVVLAVEVPWRGIHDHRGAEGAVSVASFTARDVRAVFVDEPAAAEATDALRDRLAEVEPEQWLGLPEVTELLEEHPLLWFLPTEQDQIAALHA